MNDGPHRSGRWDRLVAPAGSIILNAGDYLTFHAHTTAKFYRDGYAVESGITT